MSLKKIYIQTLKDRYDQLLNKISLELQNSDGKNTNFNDLVKDELFAKNFKIYQLFFYEFKDLSLENEIVLTNAFAHIETLLELSKIEKNFDFSFYYFLLIKDHYLKQIVNIISENPDSPINSAM